MDKNLKNRGIISPAIPLPKTIKIKGGVYGWQPSETKSKYPNNIVLKIGHSKNLKNRFSVYNTSICDPEDEVEQNLYFVIHSQIQAFDGTKIMESMIHHFFDEQRPNKKKEFFKFDRDFQIKTFFPEIQALFARSNIEDIKLYYSLDKVPFTEVSEKYKTEPKDENDEKTLVPREYQKELISAVAAHYKKNRLGGLYLPPGYGKTFISVMCFPLLRISKAIILTPRLSICNEWEKCLTKSQYTTILFNSESDHAFPDLEDMEDVVLISTYQSYLKHEEEFLNLSVDFMVCDEAHYLMNDGKFASCLQHETKKLFLTATPQIHTFDEAEEKVNTQSLEEAKFGAVIKSVSLADAIDSGRLCGYRLLIHNKPSTEECYEHIADLRDKYGRRKIILFYNTQAKAKKAFKHLQKKEVNSYYIDAKTSYEERETIFRDFETVPFGVIININILSEGVSIPCIDGVLMMEPRNSQKALIQIMGRALRLYPGKECAILCLPSDCLESLEVALTALVYDSDCSRVSKNILTETDSVERSKELIKWSNVKLRMIEIGKSGQSIVGYKIELLNKLVMETGKLVAAKLEIDNIKIGGFQYKLLSSLSGGRKCYEKELSQWKEKYPKLFELLQDRAEKMKYTRDSRIIPVHKRIELLNKLVMESEKLVSCTEEKNGIKIGSFQYVLLGTLSEGRNIKCYEKELPKWKEKYPKLFRLLQERVEKTKYTRASHIIPVTEKIELLNKLVMENEKLISYTEEKNGIKIGTFQRSLLNTLSGGRKYYEKEFPLWKEKYPRLFELLQDRAEKAKDARDSRIIPVHNRIELLNKLVMESEKLVSRKEETDDVKIGDFQYDLLGTLSGKKKLYEKEFPQWEEKYPKLFKLLQERIEKRAEKIELLNKLVIESGKLILQKEEKDSIKIGSFQDSLLGTLSGRGKLYEKELPQWKEKYPKLFKLLQERVKARKLT